MTNLGFNQVILVLHIFFNTMAVLFVHKRYSFRFVIFLMANFLALVIIEEFIFPQFGYERKVTLWDELLIFLLYSCNLVVFHFIKQQFETDREVILIQRNEVVDRSTEIEAQNEELTQQQEEILAQRDMLELTQKELAFKNSELQHALTQLSHSNVNLEEKVKSRTVEVYRLMKEMDFILYRSSHDFKGPIATVLGLVSLGKNLRPGDNGTDLWKLVEATIIRMDRMVEKFRMLIEVIHFSPQSETQDLTVLIQKLTASVSQQFPKTNLQKDLSYGDSIRSHRRNIVVNIILKNLLENAAQFSDAESVHVRLNIKEIKDTLLIVVEDEGFGISDDIKDKIFDMFFRGNQRSSGNGMGLYVVQSAVQKLKGKIKVHSVENEKTRFEISIPLA